jgi:hypothetical protein
MKAVKINSDYPDLEAGREYEVERIRHNYNTYHMKLIGSPRKYDIKSFQITDKGEPITHTEAYRRDGIYRALRGE